MGTPCQIDVKLAKPEGRKNATIKDRNGSTYKAPVFKVSNQSNHAFNAKRVFSFGNLGMKKSNHFYLTLS